MVSRVEEQERQGMKKRIQILEKLSYDNKENGQNSNKSCQPIEWYHNFHAS